MFLTKDIKISPVSFNIWIKEIDMNLNFDQLHTLSTQSGRTSKEILNQIYEEKSGERIRKRRRDRLCFLLD
jgi:hypothetical protein